MGHAQQRPVVEVGAGHEPDLLAAAAAEAERVGEGEADEGLGVGPGGGRGVEPVEVHVEGGGVVEAVDPVPLAAGHDHGVADPAPPVADADPERRVGGDGGGHHGVAQHPSAVELHGGLHPQVVTGAAPDEGDRGADDPVGAPDDLRLVADEPVGEEQQDLVFLVGQPVEAGRDLGAGLPQPAVAGVGGGGGDLEPRPAERGDDDPGVARPGGGDLPGRGAADQRRVAGDFLMLATSSSRS